MWEQRTKNVNTKLLQRPRKVWSMIEQDQIEMQEKNAMFVTKIVEHKYRSKSL